MTFFLQDTGNPTIKARQAPRGLSGFWEGLGAATSASKIRNDANFRLQQERNKVRSEQERAAGDRIGIDALNERYIANGGHYDHMRKAPDSVEKFFNMHGYEAGRMVTDMVSEGPEDWRTDWKNEAQVEEEVNARLRAEYEDLIATVEMMPDGQGIAEFLGEMVGITADVKNLPFLFMGGGSGSLVRIAGREAMINVAAEAAFLPSQFEMAERLEIPDPDVATQLAMAAGAGAILGVGVEALGRGISYWRGRNAVDSVFPGFDDLHSRAMVDEAEDILAEGRADAIERIAQIPENTPRAPLHPENRVNPDRSPLILTPDQRVTEPVAEPTPIKTTPLEPIDGGQREPISDANLIETLNESIAESERLAKEAWGRDSSASKPLINFLSRGHKVSRAAQRAAEKEGRAVPVDGESFQIDPSGPFGQELQHRGITSKTAPGLFKKGGRQDLDNLVASELDEAWPGIKEAAGVDDTGMYLDRNGLIELIVRDHDGDSSWLRSRAEADQWDADASSMRRNIEEGLVPSAEDDFVQGVRSENGLLIDPDEYFLNFGPYWKQQVEGVLDEYTDRLGIYFTPAERAEMLQELQTRGGDVEFLVERMAERDFDIDDPHLPKQEDEPNDIPFGEDAPGDRVSPPEGSAGEGRGDTVRPEGVGREEGSGTARAGDTGRAGATEPTAAGEQYLADGITPITQKDRLEAAQNAPMRGGSRAADEGLFDLGARSQMDMFSDPASPEARVMQDAVTDDLRTSIDGDGDFDLEVDMPDGTSRTMKASEALDWLDDVDAFSHRIDLCGKGPA